MLKRLVKNYPDLKECQGDIQAAFELLKTSYKQGKKLLVCGNGGSASDSEHIVGELMKGFNKKRSLPKAIREKLTAEYKEEGTYLADHLQGALPAISLVSHTALITAFSNDVAADMIFAQQVYGYGRAGDVLIGISTSGNSKNVLNAIKVAKIQGLKTIALTGRDGGVMKKHCDVSIVIPKETTPAIQERHLPVYHVLCSMLEDEFFQK